MLKRLAVLILLVLLAAPASAATGFRYENYPSLNAMRVYIEKNLPLGSTREQLRAAFVTEGKGLLKEHPDRKNVEKYIYDINLCGRYIFRWNISADYDDAGKLLQAYVNGRFVFMAGKEPKTLDLHNAGVNMKSRQEDRPRPELTEKKKFQRFRLYDIDGDFSTAGDQWADGWGPVRADPGGIPDTIHYKFVELWRSIFDPDEVETMAQYPQCKRILSSDPMLEELLMPEVKKLQDAVDKFKKDTTPAAP